MTDSASSNWTRVKELVGEILLTDEAHREARLEELTRSDEALRREVVEWLALEARASGFLDAPAPGASWDRSAVDPLAPGAKIGGYVVDELIGMGGSSVVYAAQQEKPERKVALKVFLGGLTSEDGRARFEHEAEVLASLSHPGIARVLEAGVHREDRVDRPWFAMELVPGASPVTDYVRERELDRDARVRLLAAIADAVAHGHRRGVIHRDLKAENVLIDAEGAPRVIDFGLAKLTDEGPDASRATLPGSMLGTLATMSPEHAASDPAAIDVRSDVYSLGVLAFEVLCGRPPYELEGRSLADALRVIRETPPRRPKAFGVPRDLESVLLRALEKDPERRYASADAFGADLERWLRREPVAARGASFGYHARHFLGRHRLAASATAGVLALSVAGILLSSAHTDRIERRERARLEEVKDFLLSVVGLSGPGESGRHDMPVSEWLDHAAARIDGELDRNPAAQLELHATVGKAYRELGLLGAAEDHMRRAVEIGRRDGPAPALGAALSSLSDVLLEADRAVEATEALEEALEVYARDEELQPIFSTIARRKLAEAERQLGRLDRAEATAQAALSEYERLLGREHGAVARACETLARVYVDAKEPKKAVEAARRALEVDAAQSGPDSLAASRVRLVLADALELGGDAAGAEAERSRAARALEEILPEDHPLRSPSR